MVKLTNVYLTSGVVQVNVFHFLAGLVVTLMKGLCSKYQQLYKGLALVLFKTISIERTIIVGVSIEAMMNDVNI